jgi:4-amino-4-deoxy-L-arabinose transferase-like glycosyltransferase
MSFPVQTDPPAAGLPAHSKPELFDVPPDSYADGLDDRISPIPKTNAHHDLGFTVALLVVALVPRLFVALAWAREPVWDGHYYHFGAERIAEGLGYSEDVNLGGAQVWKPWAHYPVGYSGWLAIFYRLFGSEVLTAPVVNAFSGTLLVLVIHRLARYALDQNRARIAGALCALHPGLIAYSAVVMTEPTAALFVVSAGWVALAQRKNVWGIVGTGLLLGMGTLIRPVSLLATIGLLFIYGKSAKNILLRTTLAGLVTLLTVAPWTYRNCKRMDGCALVSTNGGWNLAIGALTTTGRFQTLRASDGCPVVTGQVQQDKCWGRVGWSIIEADPTAWVAKMPLKLAQTYDHESFPVEYLHEASPDDWPEERREAGRQLLTAFHWLLMTIAALGPISLITQMHRRTSFATQSVLLLGAAGYASYCFANPEHPFSALIFMAPIIAALPFPGRLSLGPAGRYLYWLLFSVSLTHAVFFGEDRYHLVISPILCVLAAGALRLHHSPAQWAQGSRS